MEFNRIVLYLALIAFTGISCVRNEPILPETGKEHCAHCSMAITDHKFHSQILTTKGRRIYFDSLECLHAYVKEKRPSIQSVWVVLYDSPGKMASMDSASYIQSEDIRTPMGEGIAAFSDRSSAEKYLKEHKGKLLGRILEE